MKKLNEKRAQESDILEIILKPFLTVGYVLLLGFGLVYYFVYLLIIKITKHENYYGSTKDFKEGVRAAVFSDAIKEHRDRYRQKTGVRKSRKQMTEQVETQGTRTYHSKRPRVRDQHMPVQTSEPAGNHVFKRLYAYAGIFFLKEDLRKERAKEIDAKYPPRPKKEKPAYSAASDMSSVAAAKKNVEYTPSPLSSAVEIPIKHPLLRRRIMTASVSIIAAFALIFVGALAYAQELPAGLNFISPKPTADLFRTAVPAEQEHVCEITPEEEENLYMAYEDGQETGDTPQSAESADPTETDTPQEGQTQGISGNITTEPKIYKEDDEDPEVAKIQARLMELHYMRQTEVTNYYGKNTTYAMGYFQRQHSLQVDGAAGAETLAVLYSADAQEYKLEEGTEGADVKEMQHRLYELKYLSSSSYVTGYFGTKTNAAVKDFQSTNSLSSDGIVGYYTYSKLFSSSAIKNSTSSSSSSSSSGGSTATGSGSAADVVEIAMSLYNQGYIYVWGGKSPSAGGFDCSGFVYYVMNQAGIRTGYLDTTAWATTTKYTTIEEMEDVKPGDILVFSSGHVAIYIGGGKMIHSTSKGDGDPGGIYIDSFFTSYRERVWVWGKRMGN